MRTRLPTTTLLALATLVVGCTRDNPSVLNGVQPTVTATHPPATPGPAMSMPPTTPSTTSPAAAAADGVSGTVVETMDSGGYTYAKLDRGTTPVWVAGPETKLAIGTKIGTVTGSKMVAFRSNTLNRTFDEIYFINDFPVTGSAPANPHTALPTAPATTEVIAPAPGGQTIAQLFAGKTALAGKPVVVRGKVVKVNNGILDHNWLHLQDGTGAAGTNDVTITTAATVALGDVVVVRGKLVTDKDFGAGYKYDVLIEDAAIATK
ncbi:MAG: DNA-binding protein [Proteobacteria bacterium]|nr:DNA-binding protein [Pseudomonadota bacterium]